MINRLFNDWNLFFVLDNSQIWLCICRTELCGCMSPAWVRVPAGDRHNLFERVENNELCRHGCGSGRTPGELGSGFAIAIFKASRAKKTSKKNIINDTSTNIYLQNDKHLYFIWAHSCVLVPSQNSHSPRWFTFIFKTCVLLIFLRVRVGCWYQFIAGWLGVEYNLCYCRKMGRMQF